MHRVLTIGVLALQGAFFEHLNLLKNAAEELKSECEAEWRFCEVRTPDELNVCDGLVIPGGESTTMALVANRSGLLVPLREFVKVHRKPTWGTCAGLILLAEAANRTKKGGQDLIGGLDVRVDRNHFGRQKESFEADLSLTFLSEPGDKKADPFTGVFIRAPIVEKIVIQEAEKKALGQQSEDFVIAPALESTVPVTTACPQVEILGTLPPDKLAVDQQDRGGIVAIRQGHVFGTSFHPELTQDARIHKWWLKQVLVEFERR